MRKKYITIFTGEIARYLLKKGYVVIDVKPHRHTENASVFIFRNDEGLMQEVHKFKNNNDN